MIKIGCKYLLDDNGTNKYDNVYKYLIKNNFLQVLKYPGKVCNVQTLNYCINLAKERNIKIDLHGLPLMQPRTHGYNITKNIKWYELPDDLKSYIYKNRISTHIAADNGKDIFSKECHDNYIENIKSLKQKFKEKYKIDLKVGGENQSGGYKLPLREISPDTISKMWCEMDFGVFDISHAKLDSIDLNMSYNEYLDKLQYINKVKILHISGENDLTGKFINNPDKHVLIHESEIEDIQKTINIFNNIDLIDTEIAYNTVYSLEKELVIEVLTLNLLINKLDKNEIIENMKYLKNNLNEDLSNIDEALINIKLK